MKRRSKKSTSFLESSYVDEIPFSPNPVSISDEKYTASPKDVTDPAEKYIRNCARFELKVDANVVIALRTKWNTLKPTQQFSEGSMLPLMGILDNDKNIKKVNLSFISMRDRLILINILTTFIF